jgi:hypothetical protein
LKEWAKESFSSPFAEKEKVRSKLEELQLKMDNKEVTQQMQEEEAIQRKFTRL